MYSRSGYDIFQIKLQVVLKKEPSPPHKTFATPETKKIYRKTKHLTNDNIYDIVK